MCAPTQLLQAQAQPPSQPGQPPAPNPAAQQLAAQQQATWAAVCATGREQQLESKRLAKCILVYVAEHREEVAPLFGLFSVYLVGAGFPLIIWYRCRLARCRLARCRAAAAHVLRYARHAKPLVFNSRLQFSCHSIPFPDPFPLLPLRLPPRSTAARWTTPSWRPSAATW